MDNYNHKLSVKNIENITIIYQNSIIVLYLDIVNKIFYVEIINGTYNKDLFLEAIEYYKNFWIMIDNENKNINNGTYNKYNQVFIFENVSIYPLDFYSNIFNTLKSLEPIFINNLISSCLVNNSNAVEILRPLLNMYQAVRPFKFVKNLEEGYSFFNENSITKFTI